jgi:hypothetical protein
MPPTKPSPQTCSNLLKAKAELATAFNNWVLLVTNPNCMKKTIVNARSEVAMCLDVIEFYIKEEGKNVANYIEEEKNALETEL